ncbi:MAG TPA: hypothetical protein VGX23_32435 [Actinocrinis sp.]|nr:hypothetical protein [Actinocrinis sp.]
MTLCSAIPAGAHLWIVSVAGGKYYAKIEITAPGTYPVALGGDTKVGGSRTFELVEATSAADETWLVSDHDNDGNQNFARTTLHGTVVSNAAPNTFSG